MTKLNRVALLAAVPLTLSACGEDATGTAVEFNGPAAVVPYDVLGPAGPATGGGPRYSRSGRSGPVTIEVLEGVAPNLFGSSQFRQWAENAIIAARTNKPAGVPGTPAYFEDRQNASPEDFLVTDFASWQGASDPGAVFGGAYSGEFGNRVHWVTRVVDPSGGKVDIAEGFGYRVLPNPLRPDGTPETTFSSYLVLANSDPLIVGIDYGADGRAGTGDDRMLTSGTGAADEIVVFLPGISSAVFCSECSRSERQAAMDGEAARIRALGKFQIEVQFSFRGRTISSRIGVNR